MKKIVWIGICSILFLSLLRVAPLQSQEEPVYVDVSYLASHAEEFHGHYVMTKGTVEYYGYIGGEGPDFELEPPDGPGIGVDVYHGQGSLSFPPRCSIAIVVGWVNHYFGVEWSWWAITAQSWWLAIDIVHDGIIDNLDLFQLAGAYGSTLGESGWNPLADLDEDRDVDILDLHILARNWFSTCWIGGVVWSSSWERIEGATVTANGHSTKTNDKGYYLLGVSPGTYCVTAEATGHTSKSSNVTVEAGETVEVAFILSHT